MTQPASRFGIYAGKPVFVPLQNDQPHRITLNGDPVVYRGAEFVSDETPDHEAPESAVYGVGVWLASTGSSEAFVVGVDDKPEIDSTEPKKAAKKR